jgi:selenocysteine lyase/cysteine desulfurase
MTDRRKFLKQLGIGAGATLASGLVQAADHVELGGTLQQFQPYSPGELADNEDFWQRIRKSYTTGPDGLVNLNNGGVSPAPKVVQEAMKHYYDQSNWAPSYYMWRRLDQGREPLRTQLAAMAGCSHEEVALQRNASEALETVIFGLTLNRGDEVVLSKQDYPNIINAWKQREQRDGIKLIWVNLELPSEDDALLANSYTSLFTPKTKLVQVTHMINWIGQKMPVKKIADVAKARGIEVLVDGAHTFAQFPFAIPDLNCDYFGTSLHKWLGAPIGTGMLYVRQEKIAALYPLFGNGNAQSPDIRKFEHLGTRPFFIEQAIGKAIEFTETIGLARKEARLQYLKNYWMDRVKQFNGVQLHTSFNPNYACAIGLFSIAGAKPQAVDKFLLDNYTVHTVGIEWENIKGVRVTPNVYTSIKNLDKLVEGIYAFVKKGG